MEKYLLFLNLIFFIERIRNQFNYCNYDNECLSLYACYNTYCILRTKMTFCYSDIDCGGSLVGCCINNLCRISGQTICLKANKNSCTTNLDCLGGCCIASSCTLPQNCGFAINGSHCTNHIHCSSLCCFNDVCNGNKDENICLVSKLDTKIRNDSVILIVLGICCFILLIIIILLMCIIRNRYRWINTYNKELSAPFTIYPIEEKTDLEDSKLTLDKKKFVNLNDKASYFEKNSKSTLQGVNPSFRLFLNPPITNQINTPIPRNNSPFSQDKPQLDLILQNNKNNEIKLSKEEARVLVSTINNPQLNISSLQNGRKFNYNKDDIKMNYYRQENPLINSSDKKRINDDSKLSSYNQRKKEFK